LDERVDAIDEQAAPLVGTLPRIGQGDQWVGAEPNVVALASVSIAQDPTLAAACGDTEIEAVAVRVHARFGRCRRGPRNEPIAEPCHSRSLLLPILLADASDERQGTSANEDG
jgi:hypothetical protein